MPMSSTLSCKDLVFLFPPTWGEYPQSLTYSGSCFNSYWMNLNSNRIVTTQRFHFKIEAALTNTHLRRTLTSLPLSVAWYFHLFFLFLCSKVQWYMEVSPQPLFCPLFLPLPSQSWKLFLYYTSENENKGDQGWKTKKNVTLFSYFSHQLSCFLLSPSLNLLGPHQTVYQWIPNTFLCPMLML